MTIRNVCDLNLSFMVRPLWAPLGVRLAFPGEETYDPGTHWAIGHRYWSD